MNPLEILKEIKTNFPEHEIKNIELSTICDSNSEDIDIYGSVLTLMKQEDDTLSDPILFSQVCLGLCGIPPDFQEYEFPSSEHIYTFFDFLEKGKKYFSFKMKGVNDEVKQFISVCLADEGIYFLKGELEPIQQCLLDVYKEVFGNSIPKEDIEKCEQNWKKYENTEISQIPENDEYEIQVKQNIFMRDYSANLLK